MQIFGWYIMLALLSPPAPMNLPKSRNFFISQISYSLHLSIVAIYTSRIETHGILPLQPLCFVGVRSTKSMAQDKLRLPKSLCCSPLRKASAGCPCRSSRWRNRQQNLQRTPDIACWPFKNFLIQDLSRPFEIVSKLWRSYSPPKRLVQMSALEMCCGYARGSPWPMA